MHASAIVEHIIGGPALAVKRGLMAFAALQFRFIPAAFADPRQPCPQNATPQKDMKRALESENKVDPQKLESEKADPQKAKALKSEKAETPWRSTTTAGRRLRPQASGATSRAAPDCVKIYLVES